SASQKQLSAAALWSLNIPRLVIPKTRSAMATSLSSTKNAPGPESDPKTLLGPCTATSLSPGRSPRFRSLKSTNHRRLLNSKSSPPLLQFRRNFRYRSRQPRRPPKSISRTSGKATLPSKPYPNPRLHVRRPKTSTLLPSPPPQPTAALLLRQLRRSAFTLATSWWTRHAPPLPSWKSSLRG